MASPTPMRAILWFAKPAPSAQRENSAQFARFVVEYLQGWLSQPIETTGHKQAAWRADPALSGPGGCIGDIGVHAFHLVEYITGLQGDPNSMHRCFPLFRAGWSTMIAPLSCASTMALADRLWHRRSRQARATDFVCASMAKPVRSTGGRRTRIACGSNG